MVDASDCPAFRKVGEETMDALGRLEEDRSSVDGFLSNTAVRLSNLLTHGAMVDDDFVDLLLDQTPSSTVKCLAKKAKTAKQSAIPAAYTGGGVTTKHLDADDISLKGNVGNGMSSWGCGS